MSMNKMREALEFIAAWDSFPRVANADGTTTSYGVAYGSNGQRDYMRNIASKALADDDIERGTMQEQFEAWWTREGATMCIGSSQAIARIARRAAGVRVAAEIGRKM